MVLACEAVCGNRDHLLPDVRNVDRPLFFDCTTRFGACVRTLSTKVDVRSCRPSFKRHEPQRPSILRQQHHGNAVEMKNCRQQLMQALQDGLHARLFIDRSSQFEQCAIAGIWRWYL